MASTSTACLQIRPFCRYGLSTAKGTACLPPQVRPVYSHRYGLSTGAAWLQPVQHVYRYGMSSCLQVRPFYRYGLSTGTAFLQVRPFCRYGLSTGTAFLQVRPFYRYGLPTGTAFLQVRPFYRYGLSTGTAFLQVRPFYRYGLSTGTAFLQVRPVYRYCLSTDCGLCIVYAGRSCQEPVSRSPCALLKLNFLTNAFVVCTSQKIQL